MKKNKRKSKKRSLKGFSLVELLAVIVILGLLTTLGISTVSNLIQKSKETEMGSNKNIVTMAAQSYLQSNKNLVPKVIGETTTIKVSELKKNNYLTKDIKNSKGESCMENSYVRVYKLSNTEYTYTTFLYCGDDEVPDEETIPSPVVTAKFTDSSGEVKNEKLNNVSDAYLFIEVSAASPSNLQSYKNMKNPITLDGYSFKIYVVNNGIRQEAYNSGSLSGGRQEKLLINKKLLDYIDVTGVTEVSLEVTAINTLGGITNVNTSISESGNVDKTHYNDTVKPTCIMPTSPYVEDDWLNKETYNMVKETRKLTVGCDDGTGSQCIRSYFTESWPNDSDTSGAEYVYIEVKDNAGNVSLKNDNCKFRVNVDIQNPSAIVTAYSALASNSNDSDSLANKISGSNKLKKDIFVNDSLTSSKIEPTDEYYEDLFGVDTVKWMNNENFPNGVIYKIELKDNLRLDRWTWQTNAGYIASNKSENYRIVNGSNPEASVGVVPQDAFHKMTNMHGSIEEVVYVRFLTEGMRYGVFTAYDKSGNSVEIEIAANLDRTAPPVPENLNAYVYNKERKDGTSPSTTAYKFDTWTNRYVRVETAPGQDIDNLSNNTTLAGFWKFQYDARNDAKVRVGSGDYSTYSSGVGIYDFFGEANEVDGINQISFTGCDKANNCSLFGTYRNVDIDITFPVCDVEKTITKGAESKYYWLGIGETARVTATCDDRSTGTPSGCPSVSQYVHDYDYQINTNKAGAKGNGVGGSFTDMAGNTTECTATERIQIDYKNPSCSVNGGDDDWTNKSRTVVGTCSDTGGSGCVENISYTYDSNIDTTVAGPAGDNNGGIVYDKADNFIECSKNQTVRVDTVKPWVEFDKSSDIVYQSNTGIEVKVTCHDDFSGVTKPYQTPYNCKIPESPSTNKGCGHCCFDEAGNYDCDTSGEYQIQHLCRHESCGVEEYNTCRTSGCGVDLYYSCRTKACGVESYKKCQNSACGVKSYTWHCCNNLAGTNCFTKTSYDHPYGGRGYCGKTGTIYKSCSHKNCGVSKYNSCRKPECGVERYISCEHEQCGVKLYNECWHF